MQPLRNKLISITNTNLRIYYDLYPVSLLQSKNHNEGSKGDNSLGVTQNQYLESQGSRLCSCKARQNAEGYNPSEMSSYLLLILICEFINMKFFLKKICFQIFIRLRDLIVVCFCFFMLPVGSSQTKVVSGRKPIIKQNLKLILLLLVTVGVWLFLMSMAVANWQDQVQFLINIQMQADPEADFYLKINQDQQLQPVEQAIINSEFKQGLLGWDYRGEIKIMTNQNIIQLGNLKTSNLLSENCLYQDIWLDQASLLLAIRYQFQTSEQLPGFDLASWIVKLDQNILYAHPFSWGTDYDWQWLLVPLINIEPGQHRLSICAGNSGDRKLGNQLLLDQVSTLTAIVDRDQGLVICPKQHQMLTVVYQDSEQTESIDFDSCQEINFSQLESDFLTLTISSKDEQVAGYQTPIALKTADIAAVTDLQAYVNSQDQYLFVFSDPNLTGDYQEIVAAPFYRVWLSPHQDLTDASQVDVIGSTWIEQQDLQLIRPVCVDNSCLLLIASDLEPIYAAIQVCYANQFCSQLSSWVAID